MSGELVRLIFALIISIGSLILLNRIFNLHAFFCLLIAALVLGLIMDMPFAKIIYSMQFGFGSLLQQIGFIVALGSCLGIMMEKTGAMLAVSDKIIQLFGRSRSVLSLSMLGLLVGIPVFCDSGFIILSRLIPVLAEQTSTSAASLTLALSSGLYTTHSLVPPTPGPLAAAATLGLAEQMGLVMLIGIVGSIPIGLTGFFLARKIGLQIPTVFKNHEAVDVMPKVKTSRAILPLIIPILLITASTIPTLFGLTGLVSRVIIIVGQPFIALSIGLLLTIPLVQKDQKSQWPSWISTALLDAGVILLITGAGGAFGYVIKESGVEPLLRESLTNMKAGGTLFIVSAFLIAAILKSAQGSTTSSMIITTSLLAPLMVTAGFVDPFPISALVLAIGSGGMCVSHANDSYFWVVSQFGGLSPRDALRSFTLITFAQALTGLITAVILFQLW